MAFFYLNRGINRRVCILLDHINIITLANEKIVAEYI
jgi:hypothetical protein